MAVIADVPTRAVHPAADAVQVLRGFRQSLYGCLTGWADTLFELSDAVRNAADSSASVRDAECASGWLAVATTTPVAVSGPVIAVAIVTGWAIDDADASAPSAHPWVARPCMKNNPESTAPTATRRAVTRAESAPALTVSPVAIPPAGASHGTHASSLAGSSPGTGRG